MCFFFSISSGWLIFFQLPLASRLTIPTGFGMNSLYNKTIFSGQIMKKHFPIIIEQDKNGVYIVECPLFKGFRSYGHTTDEAVENITEAIEVGADEGDIKDQPTFVGIRDIELAIV
jgi:predicted RNase H-like HicB family nuclease